MGCPTDLMLVEQQHWPDDTELHNEARAAAPWCILIPPTQLLPAPVLLKPNASAAPARRFVPCFAAAPSTSMSSISNDVPCSPPVEI